jgi:phenylacetate-CoA ligase
MFVRPEQVTDVVRRHPEVTKARLVVDREGVVDSMTLLCETDATDESLVAGIADSLREVCKLRGEAKLVSVGELPNDGKVIDDVRSYE